MGKQTDNILRVLLAGYGKWGKAIFRELRKISGARCVGCSDPLLVAREAFQKDSCGVPAFRYLSEAIQQVHPNAVIIAAPTPFHFDLAKEVMEAGLHVWIEKPMTRTSKEAGALAQMSKRRKSIVFVDHTYAYDKGIHTLSAVVRSKTAGDVYKIYSTRTNYGTRRPHESVVQDLGVHDIVIFQELIGACPVAVSATGSSVDDSGLWDTAFVHVYYPHNVHAYSFLGWQEAQKARTITVAGTQGIITYEEHANTRIIKKYNQTQACPQQADRWVVRLSHQTLYYALSHFFDCIRHGRQPYSGAPHGYNSLVLLDAAERSIREGGKIITI